MKTSRSYSRNKAKRNRARQSRDNNSSNSVSNDNSYSLYVRSPLYRQILFPNQVETVITQTMEWAIGAGNATSATGNYMDFYLNSLFRPFSTTYPVTSTASSYSMFGTLTNGFGVNDNPLDLGLVAQVYKFYKVLGYHVKVMCQSHSTDSGWLSLLPLGESEIINSAGADVNDRVIASQANVSRALISDNGATNKTVTLSRRVCDDLGIPEQAWSSQPLTLIGSPPASNLACYAGLYYQGIVNNVNYIQFSVTIQMRVRLSDFIEQIN